MPAAPDSSRSRRLWAGLGLLLLVLATLALVAIPVWKIRPFVSQTAQGVRLAYVCRSLAPWFTALALAAGSALIFVLWRGARLWGRASMVLALVLLGGAVWLARFNIFEKMFAPLASPWFVRPSEATWVKDGDMVLGIERGGEAVAYPVRQLAYHHVVMDDVGDVPIVATY